MNKLVSISTAVLIVLVLFLSTLLFFKEHHVSEKTVPAPTSKYDALPRAPTVSMAMSADGHMMNMQEKLQSKVTFGKDALSIANGDTKDWTNCSLEINQTVVERGYIYTQDIFPSQKTITIPYTSFTRNGEAFNPAVSHPNNVSLMCESQGNMTGWNFFSNR